MYQQRIHGPQLALCTVQGRGVDACIPYHSSQAMSRQGWIQDPHTQDTKRFHADEKNWKCDPHVFVDSGRPFPNQPALLSTRVHLQRDTADRLWLELLRVGWLPCRPQWELDAEF